MTTSAATTIPNGEYILWADFESVERADIWRESVERSARNFSQAAYTYAYNGEGAILVPLGDITSAIFGDPMYLLTIEDGQVVSERTQS